MSENNSIVSNDNSDLDAVIKEVKIEFKMMLGKRKDLIIKLGEALERKVSDSESICEEIKNELREEIAQRLVSTRIIELYCPEKWKKKTKPKKKNENISFSKLENKTVPVMIGNQGNSIVEQAATPASDSNNNDAINNEGSANEQTKHAQDFHAGNEPENVTGESSNMDQQQILSEQCGIKELEVISEGSDLQSKSDENFLSRSQIEDPKSKLEALIHNDQEDKSFYAPFQFLFDPLQQHMASLFKKRIRYVSFIAKVDPVTKMILNVQIQEENSESEQTI